MSLNWNARNCPAWSTLSDQEKEAAIFCTMQVGMGTLTEKNIVEFAARVRFMERLGRGLLLAYEDSKEIGSGWTDDKLLSLVGLSTNVSNETRAAFIRRTVTSELDDLARDLQREFAVSTTTTGS